MIPFTDCSISVLCEQVSVLTEWYEKSCSMMKELQEELNMLQASGTCSPQQIGETIILRWVTMVTGV